MASSRTRSTRSKKARKPRALGSEDYCYITTTGRRTGRAHTIEIWFVADGDTIYMLSGDTADWVRNLATDPHVRVRIGTRTFEGTGRTRLAAPEARQARALVLEKYRRWEKGLDEWARTAFPVAIDLT